MKLLMISPLISSPFNAEAARSIKQQIGQQVQNQPKKIKAQKITLAEAGGRKRSSNYFSAVVPKIGQQAQEGSSNPSLKSLSDDNEGQDGLYLSPTFASEEENEGQISTNRESNTILNDEDDYRTTHQEARYQDGMVVVGNQDDVDVEDGIVDEDS